MCAGALLLWGSVWRKRVWVITQVACIVHPRAVGSSLGADLRECPTVVVSSLAKDGMHARCQRCRIL